MAVDATFTLATLADLVGIDSRNPDLAAGAPGEAPIARHVAGVLERLGWSPELHDVAPGRANAVAVRRGTGDGPSLTVNAHLDTVDTAGMDDPFGALRRGGRLYGRGAQDTKGGVAAALGMAKALADAGTRLRGDLVLAFVADEEYGSTGTEALLRGVRTDAAVVLEPTDLDLCVGHRGFGVFTVRTRGRTVHGGRTDLGVDANLHMGAVLGELALLRDRWAEAHRHPLLGSASLHVPVLEGGRHLFVYADACEAQVEVRTVPGQTAAGVHAEIRAILDGLARTVADFHATVEPGLWRAPFHIDPDHRLVALARDAVESVTGRRPATIVHPWWEDSGLHAEAGVDTVVLGPVGGGLHTDEEWVDETSVVELARALHHLALAYCGVEGDGGVDEGSNAPEGAGA